MNDKRYRCPCCMYKTLFSPSGSYDICPVCFWEDDPIQMDDPDFFGGANNVSLNKAKENYKNFGASEERFLKYLRSPKKDEF